MSDCGLNSNSHLNSNLCVCFRIKIEKGNPWQYPAFQPFPQNPGPVLPLCLARFSPLSPARSPFPQGPVHSFLLSLGPDSPACPAPRGPVTQRGPLRPRSPSSRATGPNSLRFPHPSRRRPSAPLASPARRPPLRLTDRPNTLPRDLQPLTCVARPRLPLADPSGPPASALPHVSPRQRGPPTSHGSPRANRSARSLTRKAHPISAPLLPSFFFPAVKPAPLLRSVAPRRHSLPRGPPQLRRAYRPASPSVSPSRSFPTQARRSRAAVVRSTLGTDHGRNCRSRF